MNPASSAMAIPLGKLKSFTAAFFSSSESDAAFIEPATPMMAMPSRVTATPMSTAAVSDCSGLSSGKKMFSSTGPMMVPSPAQVPNAIDCPSATPRYLIERPKVSPPTPQSTPKNTVIQMLNDGALKISMKLWPAGTESSAPSKGNTSHAKTPCTIQ